MMKVMGFSLLLCQLLAGYTLSIAPAPPGFKLEPFHYCVGNYPGDNHSVFAGYLNYTACTDMCLKLACNCFDVIDNAQNQIPCRITSASEETKMSSAGYTAYVRMGPPMPPPPTPPPPPVSASMSFSRTKGRPFRHFWKSCGWCPPDPHPLFPSFFDTEDVFENHVLISSTPRNGIQQVRIHYLLDLIGFTDNSSEVINDPSFVNLSNEQQDTRQFWAGRVLNFTALDNAMDQLTNLGLNPGFEIMGNPGNAADRSDRLFTDLSDHAQILGIKQLTSAIASRYITRYGADVVRQWRFESWNEPDGVCKQQLKAGIECTIETFMAYWDAIESGLRTVDSELILGGPASDGANVFLYGLISHCINGTNAITGAKGCGRVDYLNVHKKGASNSAQIIQQEGPVALTVVDEIANTNINISSAAFGNDEGDPLVGWSHDHDWRADSRYAAMVPKTINQHVDFITEHNIKYDVLSNDNGFLSYADNSNHTFQQRTLVARWSYNQTSPRSIESVRKPVLNTMALLGQLGETIYPVIGLGPSISNNVGVIATTVVQAPDAMDAIAVLVYNSADSNPIVTGQVSNVSLALSDLPFDLSQDVAAVVWKLDEINGNSHSAWVNRGSPKYPTPEDLATIRSIAELPWSSIPIPKSGNNVNLQLSLPLPGIQLVLLCPQPPAAPAEVSNLQVFKSSNSINPQVILKWNAVSDISLRTYEIFTASNSTRMNVQDTIFSAYIHVLDNPRNSANCFYVVAVDWWGRRGPLSKQACF